MSGQAESHELIFRKILFELRMTERIMATNTKRREYKMTVAGQLFNHLGLQMYSGAVPAISELISNAYDAMAKNVWITLPIGRPMKQTDEIIVKDDGQGMSYEECNSLYLSVGRNRRTNASEWTKPYNGLKPRKVQGRKGIGKLAGFGICKNDIWRIVTFRANVACSQQAERNYRIETFGALACRTFEWLAKKLSIAWKSRFRFPKIKTGCLCGWLLLAWPRLRTES